MDINILISMFFVVILVMMIALIKYVWLHSQAQERYLTAEYDLEDLEDEILELKTAIQDLERSIEEHPPWWYHQDQAKSWKSIGK